MDEAERLRVLTGLGGPVQHDLNNLVMVVTANLDLLRKGATTEAQTRQLGRVSEAMTRLEAVTRTLCDQLRAPKEGLVRASDAVKALRPLLEVLVPKPGALTITLAEDDPPQALDRTALAMRLLAAAQAAGKQGPLSISVGSDGEVSVQP
jgi:signal transduction histidine kinase